VFLVEFKKKELNSHFDCTDINHDLLVVNGIRAGHSHSREQFDWMEICAVQEKNF